MFTHLHVHETKGSLRDAFCKTKELAERGKELNMTSMAITNHGSMSGTVEFYNDCKLNGIKPIIGLEAYFTPDLEVKDRNNMFHLIILSKTNEGYLNLVKLNTEAHKNYYYKPRIDLSLLKQYKEGLIILSACMGSIWNTNMADKYTKIFKNEFKDDFYLEIQSNSSDEQKQYNLKILELAKKYDINYVVTCDVHYVYKNQAKFHRAWVSNGKECEYYPTDDLFLQEEKDIYNILNYLPKSIVSTAIENTQVVANSCSVELPQKVDMMPSVHSKNPREDILKLCRKGWIDRKLNKLPKEKQDIYVKRLLHEIDVLEKCNYIEYLLLIKNILMFCDNNDILPGFGRGSVSGSLVAYLLKFGAVDPIEKDLLFERFCNEARALTSNPDIDVDFPPSKIDMVIEYLKTKYKYVLPIRTYGYIKDKNALQIAGSVLNIPPSDIDNITKSIETIDDVPVKGNEQLIEYAKQFIGLVNNYSKHASGWIVTDIDPNNYFSIEKQGDYHVLNQEYHISEKFGFLKLDLLILSNMDIIHDTVKMINKDIDLWNIPLDDNNVLDIYRNGETDCVFQCESDLVKNFAKKLKPRNFDEVAGLISIARPGVIVSGMADQYIECANGVEEKYIHPILKEVLGKTHSALLYQESVMLIMQRIAGMSLVQADNARRIIGRKIPEELNQIIPDFINGCKNNNISSEVANEIANWIIAASGYLFNASHGYSYSYLSYVTAYLKYYYPNEYMCSVLNNASGDMEKTTKYTQVCKNMNIPVLKPNITKSGMNYTLVDGVIYTGLSSIKGVGSNLDLSNTTDLKEIYMNNNKKVLEALVKSGSLDDFGERPYLFALIPAYLEYKKKYKNILSKISEWKYKDNQKKVDEWEQKLYNLNIDEVKADENYNFASTELETLGYTDYKLPNVIKGKLIIYKELTSKKGNKYGKLTFDTIYGKMESVIFEKGMKKYKPQLNLTYMFMSNDGKLVDMKEVKQK